MHTMALDQSALLELLDTLKAANGDDVVRRSLEAVFQALIEAEATAAIGAEPHQRAETRVAQRNGYRDRLVTTAAGDVELRIPKLRAGSFFPSLLERRRRIDQALLAVVMEAYVTGTSTRKVDNLVVAMGSDTGISKSEVSRICADLDVEVAAFRDRSLAEVAFPYVTASRNIACHGRESPRPVYSDPIVKKWNQRIAEGDAFIFITSDTACAWPAWLPSHSRVQTGRLRAPSPQRRRRPACASRHHPRTCPPSASPRDGRR
jgi:hypothetical protein